ncbi:MAG TPA: P-type conjugative transfer protein TrbL [Polyangiaceae bacterium]|nr:P-type conjugative transfer protein TrbL [Polyangiaceae bacterium]
MQFNTLTLTLHNFITAFSAGYGHLQGPIQTLLALLVGVEVVLLGLWTALGGGDNVAFVLRKILHIGAWVWVVQSFPTLAKAFVESLVRAGLLAGGGVSDASLILDPSRLAGYGLDATQPLAQKLEDLGTFDIPDLLVFGLGYLAIMACFVLMAINIFLAVLEYYLFVACVGILLPFALFGPTRFLAERAIGAVVATGIKLMVLSFITSVLDPILRGMHFQGPEIALNELWAMLLTLCAMTALCWKAPALAASVLGGTPHLGGSEVVAAGAAGALAGRSLATTVVGSAAVAPASLRATQAATSLASAVPSRRKP